MWLSSSSYPTFHFLRFTSTRHHGRLPASPILSIRHILSSTSPSCFLLLHATRSSTTEKGCWCARLLLRFLSRCHFRQQSMPLPLQLSLPFHPHAPPSGPNHHPSFRSESNKTQPCHYYPRQAFRLSPYFHLHSLFCRQYHCWPLRSLSCQHPYVLSFPSSHRPLRHGRRVLHAAQNPSQASRHFCLRAHVWRLRLCIG